MADDDMSDGHKTAVFGWVNYAGYRYEIACVDEDVFELKYFEDGDDAPKSTFTFTDSDADGVLDGMQRIVQFYRAAKAPA